jgi:hypothetical protein
MICPFLAAEMLRADGKDISKKASIRKGRYLMVFNFQLAPAAAGKLVRWNVLAAPPMHIACSWGWQGRHGGPCAVQGLRSWGFAG